MPDRLRVALLAGTLDQGGAEKQLIYCARALAQAGAEVRVFSLTRGGFHEATLAALGLPPVWVGPVGHPLLRVAALARLLGRFRPHVIHSFHTFTNLYAAGVGRWIRAISVGSLRSSLRHSRKANGRWTRWLIRAPTALVVNARTVREEVLDSKYTPPGRVYLLPNVIDLTEFPPSPPRPNRSLCTLIAVGRLIPAKRMDRFLQAIAVAARHVPVRGWLVGDGPERPALEALAARLNLSPGITFFGARSDVPALLRRADVLVACSDEEGLPNVLLEAMAAALPVITTPAGDARLLVEDGVNGFVVRPEGPQALADRITELAASLERRVQMGDAGRRRVEAEFSADTLPSRLLSLYRQIAEQAHRAGILTVLEESIA